MSTNVTESNIKYHNDYAVGLFTGLRIPVDDRGKYTLKDRPFALASNDLDWELGSANRVVKYMNDYKGIAIKSGDLSDYNAGIMSLPTLRNYVNKSMLYGFEGDAKDTVMADMNGLRGYPTCSILNIEWINVDVNKDENLFGTGNETITSCSSSIPNQTILSNGTLLPTITNNKYIVAIGKFTLSKAIPFDRLFISLAVEFRMKDILTGTFVNFYNNSISDDSFAAKTECFNSGDDLNFFFRFSAEGECSLDNGVDFSDRDLDIEIDSYVLKQYLDHPYYGDPIFSNENIISVPITYSSIWTGSSLVSKDTQAPTKPLNLIIANDNAGVITFDWDDNPLEDKVVSYNLGIRKSTKSGYSWYNIPLSQASISLTQGLPYTAVVVAIDNKGNESEQSDILSFTPALSTLQIVYIDTIGYGGYDLACVNSFSNTTYYTSNINDILFGFGGIIYTDVNGLYPFNGGENWHGVSRFYNAGDESVILIDELGFAVSYSSCSGGLTIATN